MRERGTTATDFVLLTDGDGSASALGAPSVFGIIATLFKKTSLPDVSDVASVMTKIYKLKRGPSNKGIYFYSDKSGETHRFNHLTSGSVTTFVEVAFL